MWVGLTQSIEGLNRTKCWPSPEWERIHSAWWPSRWDIIFFPAFRLQLKYQHILGLEPTAFGLQLHHQLPHCQAFGLRLGIDYWQFWVRSLLTHPADPGMHRPISYNNFISTHTHTHTQTHICCWFCSSGKPWLIQWLSKLVWVRVRNVWNV